MVHIPYSTISVSEDHTRMVLDSHKLSWHMDRVLAWERGERIAPITIDMALTRACQYGCKFCVHPSTRILLADGSEKAITSVKAGDEIISNGGVSVVGWVKETRPLAKLLRLRFSSREIMLTPEHLVLTSRGWRPAESLAVGDLVATIGRWPETPIRAHEVQQSHACPSHGAKSLGDKTRFGAFYPSGSHEGYTEKAYAYLGRREKVYINSDEAEQSHAPPRGPRESSSNVLSKRHLPEEFGDNAGLLGFWQDNSPGKETGYQQNGSQIVRSHSSSRVPLCGGWGFLGCWYCQWDIEKPGLHLQEWREEDSLAFPFSLLSQDQSGNRTGRLYAKGLERFRAVEQGRPPTQLHNTEYYSRDKSMAGWSTIKAIEEAGYSPVFDLECSPYHNFVAEGLVVHNCYAMLQGNPERLITADTMTGFLDDCARMGVRGISLVSDGESTLSDAFIFTIQRGYELGISMASGTNALNLSPERSAQVLPYLTYLRVNFSAGTPSRYAEIMGVKTAHYERVIENILAMVALKKRESLPVTLGIQMVLMPQDADQILPFARLGRDLGVDYAIIKHCSDDERGSLGVRYSDYRSLYPLLREAESLSGDGYRCVIKWNKIERGDKREYDRCFGAPFLLQISGSGLVAPCGQMFNERYAKFHIGNIVEERWWGIWQSERYWEVMDYLRSPNFDPRRMCGVLCLQDRVNEALYHHQKGNRILAGENAPLHVNFV